MFKRYSGDRPDKPTSHTNDNLRAARYWNCRKCKARIDRHEKNRLECTISGYVDSEVSLIYCRPCLEEDVKLFNKIFGAEL